jgi:heme-degrading monooxygenase HmoA
MPYVLGQVKVEDYAAWESAFSSPEGKAGRRAAGAKSWQIFHTEGDPNDIMIFFEWDSLANAHKYYESEDFRRKQPKVNLSDPKTYYLEEVKRGSG